MTHRIATPEKIDAARSAMDQVAKDKIAAEENLKFLSQKWRDARDEWVLLKTLWNGYSDNYKSELTEKGLI